MSFGVLFTGKGIFTFDEFILQIENETIAINENGFENSNNFPNQFWTAPILPKGCKISIAKVNSFAGNKSLVVDGSNGMVYNNMGDNDSAGKFANINGIKIYYEIYGKGEPLLLLHGNQQSIEVFDKQIEEFSKFYQVIAVDTRGQGKSTTNNKNYSYDLFADDMNSLLQKLQIEQTNIVGWSDGGNTGLILAMKYPAKVKKLVTMGANIFIDKTVVDKSVFKEISKRIDQLQNDSLPESKNSILLYTMLLNEPRYSFEALASITCPALIMAGENDIIKEVHTKGIAQHIKNSTLKIVKNEKHEFPQDNPKYFNEIVKEFLKK